MATVLEKVSVAGRSAADHQYSRIKQLHSLYIVYCKLVDCILNGWPIMVIGRYNGAAAS